MYKLYGHSGSANHGCEAIVRSTYKIMGGKIQVLYSHNVSEDKQYGIDHLFHIEAEGKSIKLYSLKHILLKILKLFDSNTYVKEWYRNVLKEENSILLAVGGDTYCYGDSYKHLIALNSLLTKKQNKTILWGCSIEPTLLNQSDILHDMRKYNLIIARESITYNALVQHGLREKARLCYDPAFMLDVQPVELPEAWKENATVGINLSPLIQKLGNEKEILENYRILIEYLLNKTEYNIALIPHVRWNASDDYSVLIQMKEKFINEKRVFMIDAGATMSSTELKYVISKCRFMIAARTHASIAAYSTGVPTLVVGYSVKAKGIALDLFGEYKNYVLPIDKIKGDKCLLNYFLYIMNNEENIKKILKNKRSQFEESYKAIVEEIEKIGK